MAGLFPVNNINVGLFCDVFPPVMDGVAVCMQNYAYWLQKKVGDVCVVTPNVPDADYSVHDYKVFDYMSVPLIGRPPYVTGIAELDPTYWKQILGNKFKIVHAHSPFGAGWEALRISKSQRVPLVATFHSKYKDDFMRVLPEKAVNVIIKLLIEFYKQADLVWVPQESVVDVIREYGYDGKVEVMDNGSDLVADYSGEYFADARKRLGLKADDFVLLFVGQHIWEKNPRLIIEALALLHDLPFKMYFVGVGYAAEEMKALVRDRGLEDKVEFVGSITERERLTRYYAAADLFLFPSLYDNAPLVVREAAALHTPAIMADGATASTILSDGENGFLTANEPEKLASLLRELSADPERVKRVGREASRTIVRSWEDCVEEVIDRYNALLDSRGLPLIDINK